MAKHKSAQSHDDVTRYAAGNEVERMAQARDNYFRALYEAWKDMSQEAADAQRSYQEKLASITGADDVIQAQNALRDAGRGYSLAAQFAATSSAAEARDAIVSERDKYTAAVNAVNSAGKKVQEQVRIEQEGFVQQSSDAYAALQERYTKALRAYVVAHAEALTAAGDAITPSVAYTLAQQLLAISSHATWLQRNAAASRPGEDQRSAA